METRKAPGATAAITEKMDEWLWQTVTGFTPLDHGYDTPLWTRDILAELLDKWFGVAVSGRTVSLHLRRMGLSYQKPRYRASEQDPQELAQFLEVKFPALRRLAEKRDADIAFEEEGGVSLQAHSGRSGGEEGNTPVGERPDARARFNVLSTVEATGRLRYPVTADRVNSEQYIAFLRQLLRRRERPLILLADRATFHGSSQVRQFVRAHRRQLRVFFLPRHAPEYNPSEHVWEELKDKRIARQPVKDKADLKRRIHSTLRSLQQRVERVISFFHLPETQYAAI